MHERQNDIDISQCMYTESKVAIFRKELLSVLSVDANANDYQTFILTFICFNKRVVVTVDITHIDIHLRNIIHPIFGISLKIKI